MQFIDFSQIGILKWLYSSLTNTFMPILMMLFIFGIILALLGAAMWLKSTINMAYDMNTVSKKHMRRAFFAGLMLGLLFLSMTSPGHGAVTASIGADTATVGVTVTLQLAGLTANTLYACVAAHSGGNLTRWVTGNTGGTGSCDFTFSSADSDNQVPIYVYGTSSGAIDYLTVSTTYYLNLAQPSDYINPAFFILIMVSLVLIGVVLVIVKKFGI